MTKQGEAAQGYFRRGYNCCQSVVAAFAEELGLDEKLALRLSCGLGAGVGRMREVCGAFDGAVIVLSLKYTNPDDPQDKSRIYAMVQELAARYKTRNGGDSIICRELLSGARVQTDTSAQAELRTEDYYKKRPCPQLVALAADLAAEYMAENPV